jgi:hypothetical protein
LASEEENLDGHSKVYEGHVSGVAPPAHEVFVNGQPLRKLPRPGFSGEFSWGCSGEGPGHLADMLTLDLIGKFDERVSNVILSEILAKRPHNRSWTLTAIEIGDVLRAKQPALYEEYQIHF